MRPTAALLLYLCAAPALADFEAGWDAYQRGDYRTALLELTAASDQDARAALALARMHLRGEGVARDTQQALMWLRRAGDLGDLEAQFEIGNAYASGRDAPLDLREAVVWYARAAEQGHAGAQFALGALYARGEGIAPDLNQARYWIGRAAAAGWPQARAWLGEAPSAVPEGARSAQAPSAGGGTHQAEDRGDPRPRADVAPSIEWHWGVQYGWGSPGWEHWGWHYWGWYPWRWYPYSGSGVHFGTVIRN
jgi:hypothetical protein